MTREARMRSDDVNDVAASHPCIDRGFPHSGAPGSAEESLLLPFEHELVRGFEVHGVLARPLEAGAPEEALLVEERADQQDAELRHPVAARVQRALDLQVDGRAP